MTAGTAAHAHRLAIVTMVASMALICAQDTLAKLLLLSLSPVLIIWTRYALQTVLAGFAVLRRGDAALLRPRRWGLHLVRGALVVGGSGLAYGALARMPVAEFTAIYCLVPLTVSLVGRFVMHERVSAGIWCCLAGGLAGALLVLRPGGQVDALGGTLALLGVCCYTGFQTLTGVLARTDSPLTIQLSTSALGVLVLSVLVPAFWPSSVSPRDLGLLALVALTGTYGQYFMVLAFARAPASALSPYFYSAIVFSAIGGWLAFGQLPDALSMTGMAMIAAFGVASAWLQQRASNPNPGGAPHES